MIKLNKLIDWFSTDEPIRVVKETADNITQQAANIEACHRDYQATIEKYKQELILVEKQRQKETKLFLSVIDHIEDMIWAKDLEGRYILANKAFRDKFCYGADWEELQGKTDSEIASIVGENTFLTDCGKSSTEKALQVLEHGRINGKLVKLVVNRSPVYDFEGTMFATCGSSKDVTELRGALEKAIEAGNVCLGKDGKELLLKELSKLGR